MEPIETIEYHGYTVEIHQDENPESPREWDNLGTMTCFHGRCHLDDARDGIEPDDLLTLVKRQDVLALPLYMYDHSGLTMSTNNDVWPFTCCWDAGQVGFIHVTYEQIRKEYDRTRVTRKLIERIREYLQSEVKTFDQYLRGDIYGFVILDPEGGTVDSCWGYYGLKSLHEEFDYKLCIDLDIRQSWFEQLDRVYGGNDTDES